MIQYLSPAFYIYILTSSIIYAATRVKIKSAILFVINFIFLALLFYYAKKHFAILWIFIASNYILLKTLDKNKKNTFLAFGTVIFNLSLLFFFKYQIFQVPILSLLPILASLLKPLYFTGLSFFIFRILSVTFDTLYGGRKAPLTFLNFANYLLFFPCFFSGPLDRYDRFAADISKNEKLSSTDVYNAFSRIVIGAFKKGVLADTLIGFSTDSLSHEALYQLPLTKILLAHYVYVFVLYFDFSGYSDIAIGTSHLFGVRTPENFNRPFLSRNIQEFWNSWHISFMHWLRDYIYIPIQRFLISKGYKNFLIVACIGFFFVFMVAGLWHGDKLDYLLYGLFHGACYSLFLIYRNFCNKKLSKTIQTWIRDSKLSKLFSQIITFHYFYASLFFFIHKTDVFKIIWRGIIGH